MQKMRSDSTLANLTENQLADLYDWCVDLGYTKAREKAAQPAPEGLGLTIHKTTLTRFHSDETKRRRAQALSELAAQSDAGSGSSPFNLHNSSMISLIRVARTEFAHATYELSVAAGQAENYDRLERALHHMDIVSIKREQLELQKQQLALAEKRYALDRESFEYNGARVAMEHFMKLLEIHRLPDIDEDQKIQKARGVCFGRVPLDPNSPASATEPTLPVLPSLAISERLRTQDSPSSIALAKEEELGTAASARPATLKHTTGNSPVVTEVKPSSLESGHAKTQSAPSAVNSSDPAVAQTLSPQSTVLVTSAPARPDTLKHITTNAPLTPEPVASTKPASQPNVQGSDEAVQSAISSGPVLVINSVPLSVHWRNGSAPDGSRVHTISHWLSLAKNPVEMRNWFLAALRSSEENLQHITKSDVPIALTESGWRQFLTV